MYLSELSLDLLTLFPEFQEHKGHSPYKQNTHYTINGEELAMPSLEAMVLYESVKVLKPDLALEIGTYVGWSSVHIAKALPLDSKLYCVDNYIDTKETILPITKRVLKDYQNVKLIIEDSFSFFRQNNEKFDFILIDGCHYLPFPVAEADYSIKCLSPKGVIFLHDNWIQGVQTAYKYLESEGFYSQELMTDNRLSFHCKDEEIFNDLKRHVEEVFGL